MTGEMGRRGARLASLLLVLVVAASAAAGAGRVRGVDSVGLTVSDMDRAVEFYSQALDFAVVRDTETTLEDPASRVRVVRMRLGDEAIELARFADTPGRPAPADARSNDRWFQHLAIVVADMDRAYQRLRERRVAQISAAPQRLPDWNPNAGGIRAFYFKDPDGHPLELIWFPPGKGDARWQQPSERLFRGIDHTAIAVADTAASLAFYGGRLGFRVAGGSENYGDEQERLNGVPGSRVRITSLRAPAGPGIEFLEYVAPRDGRAFPAGEQASDLVHWQTRVVVDDGASLASLDHARSARPFDRPAGFAHGVTLRDPDGHALELVAP